MLKNCVLLLKSLKESNQNDEYEDTLVKNGFTVRKCKTLIFTFKNLNTLLQRLQNPNGYEGIIFTSPRSVEAVNLAVKDKTDLKEWQSKHNFVVGTATYKDASEKLQLICRGKQAGSAVKLAQIIVEGKQEYSHPFLLPHGNLKTETLTKELEQHGINTGDILVYDTESNPNIENEIAQATNDFQNAPEYIVFFSPSGVKSSIQYLKQLPDFESIKIIAIGPTTEAAMKENNLNIFGVSKNPLPNDVLDLILLKTS